jgi:hypothetical protein
MIGIEDHLEGNGDRQEIIGVHQVDLEVDEVEEAVEEVIGMVVEMEEVVVVEGEGLHLEVLRPRELSHWKRGKLSIHYGILDPCNSRELVPWPQS